MVTAEMFVQALYDVSLQAAGVRQKLCHNLNLGALEGHTSRHDKSDIAGTEDDDLTAGHVALHVHQSLRRSCGEDACRTVARDIQGASRTLSAAHAEDDGSRLDLEHAVFLVHRGDDTVRGNIHNHGVELVLNAQVIYFFFKSPGILRSGQLLLEGVKAETIVNALVQNAAQLMVTLEDQNVVLSRFLCGNSCCKSCRTAADDDNIIMVFHLCAHSVTSFVRSRTSQDPESFL